MARLVRTRAPAPVKRAQVRGAGKVGTRASDRVGVYHEDAQDHDLYTHEFDETSPPAYVKVAAGMTINLGNFESLRIDVSVSLPVDRTQVAVGFSEASDWVYRQLNDEQTRWLGQTSTKAGGKV
jgi:hypothetical protein